MSCGGPPQHGGAQQGTQGRGHRAGGTGQGAQGTLSTRGSLRWEGAEGAASGSATVPRISHTRGPVWHSPVLPVGLQAGDVWDRMLQR